jgi:hypothetical protein
MVSLGTRAVCARIFNLFMDIAVVTGASSGLGLAISRRLLDLGFRVYGLGGNYNEATIANVEFRPVPCDLGDPGHVEARIKEILEKEGAVNVLVNNAKYYPADDFAAGAPAEFARSLNINLLCPLVLVRWCLAGLKRTSGTVVNIFASTPETTRGGPVGAASAGGLRWMQENLFQQLREDGVAVSAVMPEPNRWRPADAPPGRNQDPAASVDPKVVADAVASIVQNGHSNVLTEVVIRPARISERTIPAVRELPYPKPKPIPYTTPKEVIEAEERIDREEEERELGIGQSGQKNQKGPQPSKGENNANAADGSKKKRRRRRGRGRKDRDESGDEDSKPSASGDKTERESREPREQRKPREDESGERRSRDDRDRSRDQNRSRDNDRSRDQDRAHRNDRSKDRGEQRSSDRRDEKPIREEPRASGDSRPDRAQAEAKAPTDSEGEKKRKRRRGRKPRPPGADKPSGMPPREVPPGPVKSDRAEQKSSNGRDQRAPATAERKSTETAPKSSPEKKPESSASPSPKAEAPKPETTPAKKAVKKAAKKAPSKKAAKKATKKTATKKTAVKKTARKRAATKKVATKKAGAEKSGESPSSE